MSEARKTLRVALIGCGFMGKTHSNAWRQVQRFFSPKADVEMHTLYGFPHEVEAAQRQFGWKNIATDWREVIANKDIDVVDVVTPNNVHAEIAIAAAKAGKHILCEKPLAMDVKEAQKMVAAVKKAGVVHMVNQNYRRVPAIAYAKQLIDSGAIGRIYHYRARYAQDWIADPKFPLVWRLKKEVSGSGAHGDINAHIIDIARYLVGEFDEVCGMFETFIKERPLEDSGKLKTDLTAKAGESAKMGKVTVDDAASFIGRFKNGAMANLEATRFALGRKNQITFEINGSNGGLSFDFEDMNRLQYFNNADPADRQGWRDILVTQGGKLHPYVGAWWPPGHIIGYEHTFVHAVYDFINAVVDGTPVQPTFEDGLNNQKVLEAVEKSANTRKWVKV